ncbi:penicillin acylase family protein [Sphaerisporangium flaviroseum]|uniref:Penicillin acylase family protein n=1 Tax=Sphaerisporangium flaviroseum TaxID=509199 RepID=A0ABP7IE05_9ACTN
MTMPRKPPRRIRRGLDLAGGLLLAVAVLVPSFVGVAGLPALGDAVNPGSGVWRLAADAGRAESEDIALSGLAKPVTVSFEDSGLPHVRAENDEDLFRAIGYVHARFRLSQMDLTRRQGRGELSEVIGPQALESDRFERDLGLRRAAERDWAALPAGDPVRAMLLAYSAGANDAIGGLTRSGRLPTLFKVLGYEPAEWTPVDSLVVQRLVGQKISFDDQAVRFSYAREALGQKIFDEWFPAVPANKQQPYDKGPFKKLPLAPLPISAFPDDLAATPKPVAAGESKPVPVRAAGLAKSMEPLRERLGNLPEGAVHAMGNSNAWVVAGSRTESGAPILSADPHLPHSLPSVWYQIEGTSPGYHFSGATTPGLPLPLLGKTDHFSWGLTASQRPTTLYYLEKTDPARPGQYYWKGGWRRETTLAEPIKVRGQAAVDHKVRLTAHGPILQVEGRPISVWWAGTLPSENLRGVMNLLRAKGLDGFRDSLRGWATPALNFAYADAKGNIAMLNVGVAPQVTGHDPALPLPGDGSADIAGSIAFDALPSSVNPPEGYIVSANQRETTGDYPYQYSTSYNYVERGWRDGEIVLRLAQDAKLSLTESAQLQTDWHDNHARQLVPLLLDALKGVQLTPVERRVADLLARWDYNATPDAPQPAFFDSFKNRLSWVTFQPWWTHHRLAQDPDQALLPRNPDAGAWANETLRGTVTSWVQKDRDNPFFSLPDGTKRNATDVLREAFRQSVKRTVGKYGEDFAKWRYGTYQSVLFPSLAGLSALDIGPYPWGGNPRTINASVGTRDDAKGNPLSNLATAGATMRFSIDWGTGKAETVIAGGQSENPMSPWYGNGISLWMKGRSWPVVEGAAAEKISTVKWKATP